MAAIKYRDGQKTTEHSISAQSEPRVTCQSGIVLRYVI